MTDYVRVKINVGNKNELLWAIKKYSAPFYYFTKVDRYGNGDTEEIIRLYIVCEKDIIWEKPAQMNNKYAMLELKDV